VENLAGDVKNQWNCDRFLSKLTVLSFVINSRNTPVIFHIFTTELSTNRNDQKMGNEMDKNLIKM
jgi:hypothetical protein